MQTLILASRSPRRQEILSKCGFPFTAEPADIDETIDSSLSLTDAIKDLSLRKAAYIAAKHPDAVIIGSDTVVVSHGEILGKPKNHEDAKRMLRMLQNDTHDVITGLAVVTPTKTYTTTSVSHVTFTPMTDTEITKYIATGECDDKAGSYGIQGFGGRYIENIDGDYYSIMGLPLHQLYTILCDIFD